VVMTIGVLPVGNADPTILSRLKDGLVKVFPETKALIVNEHFPLPGPAFDKKRGQYRSNQILGMIQSHISDKSVKRLLGVIDADIYVQGLNFVFGEALFPGKVALISLWRLKPEFYRNSPNLEVFAERSLKEAVHEVGHTLGLRHCPRSSCVMHFSNSIFDTDKKQALFCDECYIQAAIAINTLEPAT
jgi:archaemetzincin